MRNKLHISTLLITSLIFLIVSHSVHADIANYDDSTSKLNLDAVLLSDGSLYAIELGLITGTQVAFNIDNISPTTNQNTNISFDLESLLLDIPTVNVGDVFYSASLLLNEPNILNLQTLEKTGPFISQGRASTQTSNLLVGCANSRDSGVGTINSQDGNVFTVPAENNFASGPKATDLYNDCTGVKLNNINELNLGGVPIVEIDADGEIVSGYIFADNYFELYVSGVLIGVDPVPFTPFNSNVVRFKVKKPYTYAVKLVDWEENLGLGSEENRGDVYHAGDGGFIATFSDGIVTDASWKAQSFYIAPLQTATEIQELSDGTHSTLSSSISPNCTENCYAIHYAIPSNWSSANYNDADWPQASTYSNDTVGVDNKPSFTNFAAQFAAAEFIWSSNLVLDNLVLVRKTVD